MKKKHLEVLNKLREDSQISSEWNCSRPVDRDKPGWIDMHINHQRIMRKQHPQVCLIGDSIIANLKRYHHLEQCRTMSSENAKPSI